MSFLFKQVSSDFRVFEELPFSLSGNGDAFYVYIEKRNLTTHELLEHIQKKCHISRMSIGIAGLKDKKAIARQWISIYARALKKAGGEKVFCDILAEKVKIIQVGRHETPLNLSTPIMNRFSLVLRTAKHIGDHERAQAKAIVSRLLTQGYANCYGSQRFGIGGRNTTQGWEILTKTSRELKKLTKQDIIFKIQAYVSHCFNEFVASLPHAYEASDVFGLMDGCVVVRQEGLYQRYGYYEAQHGKVREIVLKVGGDGTRKLGKLIAFDPRRMVVTGPVLGDDMLQPLPESPAAKREQVFFEKLGITAAILHSLKEYRVYGLRRALRVIPTRTEVHYRDEFMHIYFTLPAGAYASILFDQLQDSLSRL